MHQSILMKKLLEELSEGQKPLQRKRTITIDKLCANNEKDQKYSCDLLQSINNSNGEIAEFLPKLEATEEDSLRDTLSDNIKEDQEDKESIMNNWNEEMQDYRKTIPGYCIG